MVLAITGWTRFSSQEGGDSIMENTEPDVRHEVAQIMDGVLKGLLSIPFPTQFATKSGTPEYISMHFCEKCKGYHKVKT